jgi:hypothetical protein
MSTQRKFNARRFFDSFQGHEEELEDLSTQFNKTPPTPFTTETAARAACEDFKTSDPMTIAKLGEAELDPSMPADELEQARDNVHELQE